MEDQAGLHDKLMVKLPKYQQDFKISDRDMAWEMKWWFDHYYEPCYLREHMGLKEPIIAQAFMGGKSS